MEEKRVDGSVNQRQFQKVNQYLKEEIPSQKDGKSATQRLAFKLACERVDQLKEKEKKTVENFQSLKTELRKLSENL